MQALLALAKLAVFRRMRCRILKAECWVDCLWQSEYIVIDVFAYRIRSGRENAGSTACGRVNT